MRKFNRRIKLEMDENVRRVLHEALCSLLHTEVMNMADDKETVSMASILVEVEKKINKSISQQTRKSHKFTLKYHEAVAFMDFIGLMDGVFDCVWTMATMRGLIGSIDKQLA